VRAARWCALVAAGAAAAIVGGSEAPQAPAWSGSASASWYLLPDESDYLLPIVMARRDRVHLEARYNYEDRDTASVLAGWLFSAGEQVEFEATPMLGAAFGGTDGVAAACTIAIGWKRLALYSENEYLAVPSDHDADFYYNWTELTVEAIDRLRVGIVTQRTRTFATDRELERGILAGATLGRFAVTGSWFEPWSGEAYGVVALAVEF
jgi:hypothetical protein